MLPAPGSPATGNSPDNAELRGYRAAASARGFPEDCRQPVQTSGKDCRRHSRPTAPSRGPPHVPLRQRPVPEAPPRRPRPLAARRHRAPRRDLRPRRRGPHPPHGQDGDRHHRRRRPRRQARRRHRRHHRPGVLGLVDVEDADTPGLIALEPDLAYHLVDLTLGGDPVQAPTPLARPFTAIDMALCRLHLDAILAAFAHAIGANLGRPLTKGLADPRPAPEPLAAPPRARLHRRHGLRHGPHPRRGRPARPLHPRPAALGARRDPRLDPGPQRPGRRATAPTTSGRR